MQQCLSVAFWSNSTLNTKTITSWLFEWNISALLSISWYFKLNYGNNLSWKLRLVLGNPLKNHYYPNNLYLLRLSLLFTTCHCSDLTKQVSYFCLCSLIRVRTGEIGYWLANTGNFKNMRFERGQPFIMSHLTYLTKKPISPMYF